MIVKVCGLNDPENCLAIDQLKPNMVGMIFYATSPRYIDKMVLPPTKSAKVGVFVNASLNDMLSVVQQHQLSYVQLHGQESVILAQSLKENGIKVIKCFSIDKEIAIDKIREWEPFCAYFLFDTKGKQLGGNGTKFNWKLLNNYTLKTPFLLSGGIAPTDVEALKKINNPAFVGVDINSKFELAPGIKNIEQVKLFIDALKK
jgi:phosphoribosylanthranilate isomerase